MTAPDDVVNAFPMFGMKSQEIAAKIMLPTHRCRRPRQRKNSVQGIWPRQLQAGKNVRTIARSAPG